MIRELNKSKNLEMNMRKYTVKISIVWSLGIINIYKLVLNRDRKHWKMKWTRIDNNWII